MYGPKQLLTFLVLAVAADAIQGGPPQSCCKSGSVQVDLSDRSRPLTSGGLEGVRVLETGSSPSNQPCSAGILLKVNFEKAFASSSCSSCVQQPMCGRRMLKVDMDYGTSVGGWTFNIGDSRTNNGWAGDGSTSDHDGELQGMNHAITAYQSDPCGSQLLFNHPGTLNGTRHVTVYVSNEHVRITTDRGMDFSNCTRCLYALDGQPDRSPDGVNYDVYVAFNRVISGNYRNGYGVCSARLSWACPWAN